MSQLNTNLKNQHKYFAEKYHQQQINEEKQKIEDENEKY